MKIKTMLNKIIALWLVIVTLFNYSNIVVLAEEYVDISVVANVIAKKDSSGNNIVTGKTGEILTAEIFAYNNNPNSTATAKVRYYIDQVTRNSDTQKVKVQNEGTISFRASIGEVETSIEAMWGEENGKEYLEFEIPAGASVSAEIDLLAEIGYDEEISAEVYGVYATKNENGEYGEFTSKDEASTLELTWTGEFDWENFKKQSNTDKVSYSNGKFNADEIVYEYTIDEPTNNIGIIYADEIILSENIQFPDEIIIPSNAVIEENKIKIGDEVIFEVELPGYEYDIDISKTGNAISYTLKIKNQDITNLDFNPIESLKTKLYLNKFTFGNIQDGTEITSNTNVTINSTNVNNSENKIVVNKTSEKNIDVSTTDKFGFKKSVSSVSDSLGNKRTETTAVNGSQVYVIHDKDIVTYTVEINNTDLQAKTIDFNDIIPSHLTYNSDIKITNNGKVEKNLAVTNTSNSNGTSNLSVEEFELESGKKATITYSVTADLTGITADTEFTNKATITDYESSATVVSKEGALTLNKEVVKRITTLPNGGKVTIWKDLTTGKINASGNVSAIMPSGGKLEDLLLEFNAGDIVEYVISVENNTYNSIADTIVDNHPFYQYTSYFNNFTGLNYYAYGASKGIGVESSFKTDVTTGNSTYGTIGIDEAFANSISKFDEMAKNTAGNGMATTVTGAGYNFQFASNWQIPSQTTYRQTMVLKIPGDNQKDMSESINTGFNWISGLEMNNYANSKYYNTLVKNQSGSVTSDIINHTVAPLIYINTGTLATSLVQDRDNIQSKEIRTYSDGYLVDWTGSSPVVTSLLNLSENDMNTFAYDINSVVVNYVYIYNDSDKAMNFNDRNFSVTLPSGFKWLGFVGEVGTGTENSAAQGTVGESGPYVYFDNISNTVDTSNYYNSSYDIFVKNFRTNGGEPNKTILDQLTGTTFNDLNKSNKLRLSASLSGRNVKFSTLGNETNIAPYTGVVIYYAAAVDNLYEISPSTPSTFTALTASNYMYQATNQLEVNERYAINGNRGSVANSGTVNTALTEKNTKYDSDTNYNSATKNSFSTSSYNYVWSHVNLTTYVPEGNSILYVIQKVDADNQNQTINKNVSFEMLDSNGDKVKFVRINTSDYRQATASDTEYTTTLEFVGSCNILSLEEDDYTLVEIEAPEGYEKGDNVSFNVSSEKAKTIKVKNKLKAEYEGAFTINKTDATTNEIIDTAKFEIYDSSNTTSNEPLKFIKTSDGNYEYTEDTALEDLVTEVTTKNGIINVSKLPYKTFYALEIEAPDGYIAKTGTQKIVVSKYNEAPTVTITNTRIKASINIEKKDSELGTNITQTSAVFQILDSDNTPLTFTEKNYEYTYSEKGTVTEIKTNPSTGALKVVGLYKGEYKLKETTAPLGYELSKNTTTITVNDTTEQTISFENTKEKVDLKIVKRWKSEDNLMVRPLSDVRFVLYELKSSNIAEQIEEGRTDDKGYLTLSDALDLTNTYFLYEEVPTEYSLGNNDVETVMLNESDGKIYTDVATGTAGYKEISVIRIELSDKLSEIEGESGSYVFTKDIINVRNSKNGGKYGSVSYETIDNYKTAELTGITKEKAYSFYSEEDYADNNYNYVHVLSNNDVVTYNLNIKNISYFDFENLVIINTLPNVSDTGVANISENRDSEFGVNNVENLVITVDGAIVDSSKYRVEYSDKVKFTEDDFNGEGTWSSSQDDAKSFRVVFTEDFVLEADQTVVVSFDGTISEDAKMGQIAWNNFAYRYVATDGTTSSVQNASLKLTSEPPKVGVMVIQEPEIEKVVDVATNEIFYFDVIDVETNKVVGTAEVKAGETGKLQLKRTENGETVGYLVPGKKYRVKEKTSSKYNFDKLSSTTASEHSDTQKCNTSNFEFTYDTEEAVKVKFENKKKVGTVVVHHYVKGTGEEFENTPVKVPTADKKGVNENITTSNYIDESYTSSASTDIFSAYKLVSQSTNTSGSYIDGTINVYYYYDYDDFKYTIRHHYENKETREFDLDDTLTREKDAVRYGTEVQASDADKVIKTGYRFKNSNPEKLTITENENNNIIDLYYELEDYKYTVNYYYDGELKETNSNLEAEYKDIINTFEDKPNGYVFEKLDYNENGTQVTKENKEDLALLITENENKNVINIYYRTQYEITKEVYEHEEKLKDGTVQNVKGGTIEFEDSSDNENVFKNDDGTKNLKVTPDDGYVIVSIKVETDDNPIELTKEEIDALLDDDGTLTLTPEDLGLENLQDDKNIVVEFRKKSDVIVKYLSATEVDEEGNPLVLIEEDRIDGYEGLEFITERKFKEHYQASDKGITDENDKDITDYDQVDLDENNNAKGQMYADELVVIYWYERIPAKVIIKYVDIDTGEEIATEDVKEGVVEDSYDTERKDIENYIPAGEEPENKSGEMTEEDILITYYYKKQFKITTEVLETEEVVHKKIELPKDSDQEKTSIKVKGGIISGEDEEPYEIVERGDSSKKEIILKPNKGYKIESVTKNGEPIEIKDETGFILDQFEDMQEDIHIVVKYERIKAKLIVQYIDEDTGKVIGEEEEFTGNMYEKYSTNPKDIDGYELVIIPENKNGELSSEETIVKYYYRKIIEVETEKGGLAEVEESKETEKESREIKKAKNNPVTDDNIVYIISWFICSLIILLVLRFCRDIDF